MTRPLSRSRHHRFAALALAVGLALPGFGAAHAPTNGFFDSFEQTGPLPANPGDEYEIKSGSWVVGDIGTLTLPGTGSIAQAGTRRVLLQQSRLSTPNEPVVFIRGREFREFTAQVTAALIDDIPGASIGLVFRAPVHDGVIADPDNLYLFSAERTGIVGPFTTGQAFVLWKRVAGGYYMLHTKIANTRFDLTQPHEYKVVMHGGHIQAFVDGRLVIEHRDVASGDQPTLSDPFPGLPFDRGAIGLRTSVARAWFDDFTVIGNNAYEGRANAIEVFAEHGVDVSGVRDGAGLQLTNVVGVTDTGFRYHDHDGFDDAVVEPFDPFASERFSGGMDLRTQGIDGTTVSTARLGGVNIVLIDPTRRLTIQITGNAVVQRATASCSTTTSKLSIDDGVISVSFDSDGLGGVPPQETTHELDNGYAPNTKIYESPGQVTIFAHSRVASPTTKRIEASALRIILPDQAASVGALSSGQRVPNSEITIGNVVAARYCS